MVFADRRPAWRPAWPACRPADLVLLAGLGLAALVLGVVPLSAEVDRLMGTPSLPFQIQLELTRPWWLLGLAALPVLVYYFYRSLVDFARWQRVLSLWLRAAIVILLLLALAGLNLVRPTRELFVVFAVDRSQSVGDAGEPGGRRLSGEGRSAGGLQPFRRAAVRRRAGQRPQRRRRRQ